MENQNVDRAFLDAIDVEIARALEQAGHLEAGLDAFFPEPDSAWQDSFDTMSRNLSVWRDRLEELTRQTAAVETELNDQEHSLRDWFHSLGTTRIRLEHLAAS
ncbi:MAG: hypothetical protein K8T89_23275 [Planctomycetes bacterium]|nr:hypothetical protein [Planctomycetota bacterium]